MRIHVEAFCGKGIYKLGFCLIRYLISLISLVVLLLFINEVLLDLGLTMMIEVELFD